MPDNEIILTDVVEDPYAVDSEECTGVNCPCVKTIERTREAMGESYNE